MRYVVAAAVVLVLWLLVQSYLAFRMAFGRPRKDLDTIDPASNTAWAVHAGEINEGVRWGQAHGRDTVEITSFDGLKLRGVFIPAENAERTVLCVHGYHGNCYRDFSMAMRALHENGCHLLLIHQRSHGDSEGKYITMGEKERFDCQSWAEYLYRRMGPEHPIYLDGVSMGCTTVLLASALPLPPAVRGIIADCGYTSAAEIVKHVMKKTMHIPAFPLLPMVNMWCRLAGGFSLYRLKAPEELRKNTRPVLFAHGTGDTFVPCEMTQENYQACRAEKFLLLVPGAAHCMSYVEDREKYTSLLHQLFRLGEEQSSGEPFSL